MQLADFVQRWSPAVAGPRLSELLKRANANKELFEQGSISPAELSELEGISTKVETSLQVLDEQQSDRLSFLLSRLASVALGQSRYEDAAELFLAAHEVSRLRHGARVTETMRRTFYSFAQSLICCGLRPVAGRDVNGDQVHEFLPRLQAEFPEYDQRTFALAYNGYLVEGLQDLLREHAEDTDFRDNLVKQNLKLLLTLPVPKRYMAARHVWRELAEVIAPYILLEIKETQPQAEDSIGELLGGIKEKLQSAISGGNLQSIANLLDSMEGDLTRNLLLRLDAEAKFRPPVSAFYDRTVQRGQRTIDPLFNRARALLEKNDPSSTALFEELQRKTSKHPIASEWLAYSYTVFEPHRTNHIIRVLEDCISQPRLAPAQWVARWNLACMLRRQALRQTDALSTLLPILKEANFHAAEVLDLCLLWAIEDGAKDILPSLLRRCRHPEAIFLGALSALQGEERSDRRIMQNHLLRMETILHEPRNLFPSPEEELSEGELAATTAQFLELQLHEAGIEWFRQRLSIERNRRYYLNHKQLGRLLEAAGDLKGAWDSYADEAELGLRNNRVPQKAKLSMLVSLLQFGQENPVLRSEAFDFLARHWKDAGMRPEAFETWQRNLTSARSEAQTTTRASAEEAYRPNRAQEDERRGEREPAREVEAVASPTTDFAAIQLTIDQLAQQFQAVRGTGDLMQRLPQARQLCTSIGIKNPDIAKAISESFVAFCQLVEDVPRASDESEVRGIVDRLPNYAASMRELGQQYRDLRELSEACLRTAKDIEVQLAQPNRVSVKLPSSLGMDLDAAGEGEIYDTRLLIEVTNPYEYELQLRSVQLTGTHKSLIAPQEALALTETIPQRSASVVEIPITVLSASVGDEAFITIELRFASGGLSRAKRESGRIKFRQLGDAISVQDRYTTAPVPPGRNDLFHGREKAIQDLRGAFPDARLRTLYFVSGIRRVGKTTLLRWLGYEMGDTVLPILLNLEAVLAAFGRVSRLETTKFIRELMETSLEWVRREGGLNEISFRALSEDDFGRDPVWRRFDQWLTELLSLTSRRNVLLCIDEMQTAIRLISAGVLDDSFLTWLRQKVETASEILVVCTASEPYGKMRMRFESNLWGSIKSYPISFLPKADMAAVAEAPVKQDGVRWLPQSIDALWDMTEGHPWVTQNICDRILRDLNKERRRIVGPGDIRRATDNLILDDPTGVRLWWNESQELVTADMEKVAYLVLELQAIPRQGVNEQELVRESVKRGIRNPGNLLQSMIELELLTRRRDTLTFAIRSRFLEEFLQAQKSLSERQEAAVQEFIKPELVAIMVDWENAKHSLFEFLNAKDDSRQSRLRPKCNGDVLGKRLLEKSSQFGQSTRETRLAVAGFEDNAFFKGDRAALDNLNFVTENSNVTGNSKADRSDLRLFRRIRDTLERQKDVSRFIIVTGDADFSESVMELLDRGKEVLLIASEKSMSHYFKNLEVGQGRFSIEHLEDFAFIE